MLKLGWDEIQIMKAWNDSEEVQLFSDLKDCLKYSEFLIQLSQNWSEEDINDEID
jgi:hypothetical protein